MATEVVTPLLIGGTAPNSTLTLESTSGAGTTDYINFLTGSQVERMRIDNAGQVIISNGPITSSTPALKLSQTWNNAGASFTGVIFSLTDTASLTASNFIDFQNGGLSKFAVQKSGHVYVGGQTTSVFGSIPGFQFNGDGPTFACQSWSNNFQPSFYFCRSLGNPPGGTHVAVTNGTQLAYVSIAGSDGTAFRESASVQSAVDGAVAANSVPGRLTFHTTPVGSTVAAERIRIDNAGNVGIGVAATTILHVNGPIAHPITWQNANTYTLSAADAALILGPTAACTLTLPTGCPGRMIHMVNRSAFAISSASANVQPLAGGALTTAILAGAAGKWCILQFDGTNWQIIAGN